MPARFAPSCAGDLWQLGRCLLTRNTSDGIHRCHAELIRRTVVRAYGLGLPSVLPTFEPQPAELISPRRIILDVDSDLCGWRVALEFARRWRGMVDLDDVDSLVAQMKQDVEQTRGAALSPVAAR